MKNYPSPTPPKSRSPHLPPILQITYKHPVPTSVYCPIRGKSSGVSPSHCKLGSFREKMCFSTSTRSCIVTKSKTMHNLAQSAPTPAKIGSVSGSICPSLCKPSTIKNPAQSCTTTYRKRLKTMDQTTEVFHLSPQPYLVPPQATVKRARYISLLTCPLNSGRLHKILHTTDQRSARTLILFQLVNIDTQRRLLG